MAMPLARTCGLETLSALRGERCALDQIKMIYPQYIAIFGIQVSSTIPQFLRYTRPDNSKSGRNLTIILVQVVRARAIAQMFGVIKSSIHIPEWQQLAVRFETYTSRCLRYTMALAVYICQELPVINGSSRVVSSESNGLSNMMCA